MLKQTIKSKKYILNNFNQIDIFATYLSSIKNVKITASDILYLIKTNSKINSPLRVDNNPSVGFKYNNHPINIGIQTDYNQYGKLRMKDFTSNSYNIGNVFWGDCFDLVSLLLNKNIKDNSNFIEILEDIYLTMSTNNTRSFNIFSIFKDIKFNKQTKIYYTVKSWNSYDISYWKNRGVSLYTLKKWNVEAVNQAWLNGNLIYTYSNTNPCYAYNFGYIDSYNIACELYFPLKNKKQGTRFITNYSVVRGLNKFKSGDILILHKSYKDMMAVDEMLNDIIKQKPHIFSNYGLFSNIVHLTLASETQYLSMEDGYNILRIFKYTYSLFDYDKTGINAMNYHKRWFNIIPLYFDNSYKCKDFTEHILMYGVSKTKILVINLIKQLYGNSKR